MFITATTTTTTTPPTTTIMNFCVLANRINLPGAICGPHVSNSIHGYILFTITHYLIFICVFWK